jgi:hypothetical protein
VAKSKRGGERAATTWVHVFEKDTPEGAVYLPEDADIPLSRRPRERLELGDDGEATLLEPGPDDRFVEKPARWTDSADEAASASRRASNVVDIRIVERTPDRLVVRIAK